MTEDEMVGWHHLLNEHEFEQTPGDRDGWGSLVCCNPRSPKESDMTEQLNNDSNHTVDPLYLFCPLPTPFLYVFVFYLICLCILDFFAHFVFLDSSYE